eukprot:gnl/TRDRNA2_/TRDRNA2_155433_c0_seq1.p1 gnl/TRDRNA2_/TRDRNA2_155433_c0~~gnl/TRDRNA2_/TRDRNA2_155433_c0_seq1.p1  ORF type:complete len:110 (-),score=15.84 gnl/TRDRNA2_/TRDRNA2_155433_c0_seq1:332-661(-)
MGSNQTGLPDMSRDLNVTGVASIPVDKICMQMPPGHLRTALNAVDMLQFVSNWGKDNTAASFMQRMWDSRGQTNPLYRDYDLRLSLYIMFLFHYDFGIHDVFRMMSRME